MTTAKIWSHGGSAGDVLYHLTPLKDLWEKDRAEHEFYINRNCHHHWRMPEEKIKSLLRLIDVQPYIAKCGIVDDYVGVNLDHLFRNPWLNGMNLSDIVHHRLRMPHTSRTAPWLFVADPKCIARVVMHRSPRYHVDSFNWTGIVRKYGAEAIFVGHWKEHQEFVDRFGPVRYYATQDYLDLAQIIAGAVLFVGNQSSPAAVAQGLRKYMLQETVDRFGPDGWAWNCLLPGAKVQGNFSGASRAFYSGKACELLCRSGAIIRVTADHPIFTSQGRVAAQHLYEGQHLARYIGDVERRPDDKQDEPVFVEDVFSALKQLGGIVSSCPPTTFDFHGDTQSIVGNVEVVLSKGELLQHWPSCGTQGSRQSEFVGAGSNASLESSFRSRNFPRQRITTPSSGAMRGGDAPFALASGCQFSEGSLCIGKAAQLDASLHETSGQGLVRDANFYGELINRFPGQVATDQIIKIRNFQYTGHVYDLQSPKGFIVMDRGIIVSNCHWERAGFWDRSDFLPELDDLAAGKLKPAARRKVVGMTNRIVFYGDSCEDRFTDVVSVKINPESGVPVYVRGASCTHVGGAANAARVLEHFPVEVVRAIGPPTVRKERLMYRGRQCARVDDELSEPYSIKYYADMVQAEMGNRDTRAVVISDYHEGAADGAFLAHIFDRARAAGVHVVLDPKKICAGVDYRDVVLKCNRAEAAALTDAGNDGAAAQHLFSALGCRAVVVTREERGPVVVSGAGYTAIPDARFPDLPFQNSGAGDSFAAFLAWWLILGVPVEVATERAYKAAAAAGFFPPFRQPVLPREVEAIGDITRLKLMRTREELLQWCQHRAGHGHDLVVTNGCFDLLHVGHVLNLAECRAQGSHLLVLVNDDESVYGIKSALPVVPLADRMRHLAELECVTAVASFGAATPAETLMACCEAMGRKFPVLAKGPDYVAETTAGVVYAEKFHQTSDYGVRTSKLVEKIKGS